MRPDRQQLRQGAGREIFSWFFQFGFCDGAKLPHPEGPYTSLEADVLRGLECWLCRWQDDGHGLFINQRQAGLDTTFTGLHSPETDFGGNVLPEGFRPGFNDARIEFQIRNFGFATRRVQDFRRVRDRDFAGFAGSALAGDDVEKFAGDGDHGDSGRKAQVVGLRKLVKRRHGGGCELNHPDAGNECGDVAFDRNVNAVGQQGRTEFAKLAFFVLGG